MARQLIENLAQPFDPSQYTDEYRANLMKIIKAKLKGKEAKLVEHVEPRQAEVVDLMERLRQSLQGAGTKARKSAKTTRSRKASGAAKRPAVSRPLVTNTLWLLVVSIRLEKLSGYSTTEYG